MSTRFTFRLEIAGQVFVGEVCMSEPATPIPIVNEKPHVDAHPPGRPSFDSAIDEAIADLGPRLDPCWSLAKRARQVLGRLAEVDVDPLPSLRTVETRLAGHLPTKKVRRNSSRKNSSRI